MLKLNRTLLTVAFSLLIVGTSAHAAASLNQKDNIQKEISGLFARMLVKEQRTLSWKCAVEQGKKLLEKLALADPKNAANHRAIAGCIEASKNVADARLVYSQLASCVAGLGLDDDMTVVTDALLDRPIGQIKAAIANAVSLNGKVNCAPLTMHDREL